MIIQTCNRTLSARLRIVEEHVSLENEHNLDGIMGTFGETARYDDEPWGAPLRGPRTGSRILHPNATSHPRLEYWCATAARERRCGRARGDHSRPAYGALACPPRPRPPSRSSAVRYFRL